jgi:uncharacterized protein (TIRG00374 family)
MAHRAQAGGAQRRGEHGGRVSAQEGSEGAPAKGRLEKLGGLKYVFVAVLMGFVATLVPWKDQLAWKGEAGSGSAKGEIVGDWKLDEVRFRPEGDALGSAPAAVRDALASGAPLRRSKELDWQPGMTRVFREIEPRGLVYALGLIFAGIFICSTRWWLLLGAAGVSARWVDAVRLTSLGIFFNIVVPGLTGGDLIKALLVAKENPGRRTAAVVSVFVDRALGLFTLLAMGAVVILTVGREFSEVRGPLLVCVVGGLVAGIVYTSAPLRRLVRFDAIVRRLPLSGAIQRLDEAVLIYSRHKLVLLLSFLISAANHVLVICAIFFLGRAFGDRVLEWLDYVIVVSVGNTVSALPIAPGGWGVGEAIYAYLFTRLGGAATLGVATSVGYRLCNIAIGLLGGLCLFLPGAKAERARIEELRHGAS